MNKKYSKKMYSKMMLTDAPTEVLWHEEQGQFKTRYGGTPVIPAMDEA
jgi:hypothetical protein